MMGTPDAVEDRVPHVDVRRRHVDLRPQHEGAIGKLAGPHAAEEVETLVDRPVAPWAVPAGLDQGSPVVANLV